MRIRRRPVKTSITEGENTAVTSDQPITEPIWSFGRSYDGLHQVLLNLINNSVDAMPEGGTLSLTTRTIRGPEAAAAELIVEDTGTGFAPEIVDQPSRLLGRVDVAREQDEAQGFGVAEEVALVGQEFEPSAAEDDGSGRHWGRAPGTSGPAER